jgi:hypothetical protein
VPMASAPPALCPLPTRRTVTAAPVASMTVRATTPMTPLRIPGFLNGRVRRGRVPLSSVPVRRLISRVVLRTRLLLKYGESLTSWLQARIRNAYLS